MDGKTKLFKKSDFILIIIILIICGAFLIPRIADKSDNLTAVLYIDGAVERTIELDKVSKPYEFTFGSKHSATVRVENGRIRYLDADCPDKVCVNTGWLSHSGDTASCLPARTVIRVQSEKSDVDIMVY